MTYDGRYKAKEPTGSGFPIGSEVFEADGQVPTSRASVSIHRNAAVALPSSKGLRREPPSRSRRVVPRYWHMSHEASTWVWDHAKASGNDLIVLLKIADNANADGGGAYPGIAYLARTARISKRAVYDCLRRLKASGELAEEVGGGGRGRKTTYRVLMGNGAEVAPIVEGNGEAPRSETVQPAARNGADPRIAYMDEPPLNPPENQDPPTPLPSLALVAQARPSDEPMALFEYWQTFTGRRRAVFSTKRRRLAAQAVKTYGLDYCTRAVEGWQYSPFHRGENERGTVYNDFELIFRDSQQIERFYGYADGSGIARPTLHGRTDWQTVGEQWGLPAIGGGE